jgi:hypothetical protein
MNAEGEFAAAKGAKMTIQEMIPFHGIVLNMSFDKHKLGGYMSYLSICQEHICGLGK